MEDLNTSPIKEVKVVSSDELGRDTVAVNGAAEGDVLVRSQAFCATLFKQHRSRYCSGCLKLVNLGSSSSADMTWKSCKKCDRTFCPNCKDQEHVNKECKLYSQLSATLTTSKSDDQVADFSRFVLSHIIKTQRLADNGHDVPDEILHLEDNQTSISVVRKSVLRECAKHVANTCRNFTVQDEESMFKVACQLECNSMALKHEPAAYMFSYGFDIGLGVFGPVSMINHCCVPNCDWFLYPSKSGITMIVKAVHPIPMNESLSISYANLFQSQADRRAELVETCHFICKCSVCAQVSSDRCQSDESEDSDDSDDSSDSSISESVSAHFGLRCKSFNGLSLAQCPGWLFPQSDGISDENVEWRCSLCGNECSIREYNELTDNIGEMLGNAMPLTEQVETPTAKLKAEVGPIVKSLNESWEMIELLLDSTGNLAYAVAVALITLGAMAENWELVFKFANIADSIASEKLKETQYRLPSAMHKFHAAQAFAKFHKTCDNPKQHRGVIKSLFESEKVLGVYRDDKLATQVKMLRMLLKCAMINAKQPRKRSSSTKADVETGSLTRKTGENKKKRKRKRQS